MGGLHVDTGITNRRGQAEKKSWKVACSGNLGRPCIAWYWSPVVNMVIDAVVAAAVVIVAAVVLVIVPFVLLVVVEDCVVSVVIFPCCCPL